MDRYYVEKVLSYLLSNIGNYVSSSEISRNLGISRVLVYKAIKLLKDEGYVIESHSKKGYKLINMNDLSTINNFISKLNTYIKYIAHYVPYCTSTQDIARSLAESNAPEGLVIIAEEMSSGRGRLRRYWYAPKGGLWFTLILKPRFIKSLQLLSLSAGLAVVKSLRSLFNIDVRLKWPNDILYSDKKLAGILIEAMAELDAINYVLLGVGINVNNEIPSEIENIAISLKHILNKEVPRIPILKSFLVNFDKLYLNLMEGNVKSIISEWKEYSETIGKYVKVVFLDKVIEGKAIDINDDGCLVLLTNSGRRVAVEAGDVIHLR